ncbi:hypothetical protein OG413_46245 [Streptomyces sp. NBC_01433]|uniref:DUF6919 domain-containing protein n=1 Tax=Streptomyces sp. NBC_01433 TaxID=2903864 RepID=UPI00224E9EB0|nr:hypothetical protein [Streptomyces sp. NBC_01433]MCX4682589.1 hypothetical protein [Streptomyces sp. NBC_01433]
MKIRLPWMNRLDRNRWKATQSVGQLGGLMALWLEGHIASWPGYQPNWGPDEETSELIPTLAAANRAGYVTIDSQPGEDPVTGSDGLIWEQRAAVEGFVRDYDLLRALVDAAETAGLDYEVADTLDTGERGIVVTLRGGEPHTTFGGYIDDANLRHIWPGIGSGAMGDVFRSVRVTLVAPEYGAAGGEALWNCLNALLAARWADSGEITRDADMSGSGDAIHGSPFTRTFTNPAVPVKVAVHHWVSDATGGGYRVMRSYTVTEEGEPRIWNVHEVGSLGAGSRRETLPTALVLARSLAECLTSDDIVWTDDGLVLPRGTADAETAV